VLLAANVGHQGSVGKTTLEGQSGKGVHAGVGGYMRSESKAGSSCLYDLQYIALDMELRWNLTFPAFYVTRVFVGNSVK